jgi:hypothetical protein
MNLARGDLKVDAVKSDDLAKRFGESARPHG